MSKESFSLQIGKLLFEGKSIGYMAFSLFIMGLLAGIIAAIYTDNSNVSVSILLPLLLPAVLSIIIFVKGIRKAKVVK